MIVSTEQDAVMIDLNAKKDYDLDKYFKIGDIKNVVSFEENFYILANKRANMRGYFLIRVN